MASYNETYTTDVLSLCQYWLSMVGSWCWERSLEVQCCSTRSGWHIV